MSINEVISLAHDLVNDQQTSAAIDLYMNWLQENPESTYASVMSFNLGVLYISVGNYEAGIQAYQSALQAGSIEAGINLGLLCEEGGDLESAVALWNTLLEAMDLDQMAGEEQYCGVLNNLGRVLEVLGRLEEAERAFARSLTLRPEQAAVINHRIFLRQQLCLWPVADQSQSLNHLIVTNIKQMRLFPALIEDSERQASALNLWMSRQDVSHEEVLYHGQDYQHDRIRMGLMVSGDQTTGSRWLNALITQHNPERYQIFLFIQAGANIPQPVLMSDMSMVDIGNLSATEAACIIREHEIEILIDTEGFHRDIFALRPARIHVVHPGLPCITDHAALDYMITDDYVWPTIPNSKKLPLILGGVPLDSCTSNTPGHLEDSLQRQAWGLPNTGMVYCYQGEACRITESWFTQWMQILERVSGSVLWLCIEEESVFKRLQSEAIRYGIAPDRLIFGVQYGDTPLACADLFLDTHPGNADEHTLNALAQGVPVLTCSGNSPASRMTGSYLNTLGIPELIAPNQETYLETAVRLGNDPERMSILRAYLNGRRHTSSLFNTGEWVKSLESLYERVWNRENGLTDQDWVGYQEPVDPKPFFTVVVVHYEGSVSRNEAIRCLQSLYHQKYNNFEIILLHDGPRSLPWETIDFPPPAGVIIKTHCTGQRYNDYGHSLRDIGIRMARGEYVLITNADNYHYTDMLMRIYMEIIKPYPKTVLNNVNRTAPDIIIYGILASGYISLGTHDNIIDFREFNMQMARQQWMYLSGYPSIVKNIDCMQFVMRRELWLREGGWYIKDSQAADGVLFQDMVKRYGIRYVVGPLAEHL